MRITEIEKSKAYTLADIVEYIHNSVVCSTIIRKTTGNVCIMAIDTGETLAEKISPFDTLIQVVEGIAEVVIEEKLNILQTGEVIIIPAHASNVVKANKKVKILSTVIKSGYEGSSL